ncbi:MAG TPA: FAD-dependent oxidoreductase [Acidobacteriaceae bacterium]|nr:FAD-dependent oxidoreductase [Acidobacteriaceae bacterium]
MAENDGLDFGKGIDVDRVSDGDLVEGKVGDEDVLLVRRRSEFIAIGAHCTHYGGPLAKGLVVGDEIRCPLHHACFSLKTGEVLRNPAFDPIPCWRVEQVGNTLFVREKLAPPTAKVASAADVQAHPEPIVIVGGGAAGMAAAITLRREGYQGRLTMLSADSDPPCDRPNLSKDYLSGDAPDDWMPLRPADFLTDQKIDLVLKARVASLDPQKKELKLENGKTYGFGALLLATGAEPVTIPVPGADDSQLRYLRSWADARSLIKAAAAAKQVLIVGASFIGLEVAASLRKREIAVHIAAREGEPLERVLGKEIGKSIRELHESHGVVFHKGETIERLDGRKAILTKGTAVEVDFVVLGVGVRPAVTLAEKAGLKVDNGVVVDQFLETSAKGIFAAGDIARWPDARSGKPTRIEHWVVAERMGQAAAKNMLGRKERFDAVPFFWTQQYDLTVRYTGHAEKWDSVEMDGSPQANCAASYKLAGEVLAVATIDRDLQNLKAEAEMESRTLRG